MTLGPAGTSAVAQPERARRRARVAVAATLLAVASGVGGWAVMRDQQGPLHYPRAGQDTIGFANVAAGSVLTFGAVYVLNSGDANLVLRSAELVGGDPTVASVTAGLTAGPDRTLGGVAAGRSFPPDSDFGIPLQDIDGTVVKPEVDPMKDAGTELLLRVDVAKAELVNFTGVKIVYEYKGDTYTYVDPTGLLLCPKQCPSLQSVTR